MKGLILKDLYGLKAYGKTMLVLFIIYFFTAMFSKSNATMSAFIGVFCMILPITTFTYDKYYKWDEFAASLPLGRQKIVLAKYLFTTIIVVLAMLVVMLVSTISTFISPDGFSITAFLDTAQTNCIIMSVYVLLPAIMLPIMFKFGPEKGRIVMFIVIGAFSAGAVALVSFLTDSVGVSMSNMSAHLAYMLPLTSFLLLFVSYFISYTLYKSRDL